ncbi:hypothetical protein L1987_02515 [Smallanthus sonchifolius]|uniref:Uncharacterized protein n=1 Tax=Smallanthus sonchifolius TaxID=185202 RepID=A0ACB9K873_9ASTR|nr:hypothetical protein L1987_02515 [Smallanthus sonchifolius]
MEHQGQAMTNAANGRDDSHLSHGRLKICSFYSGRILEERITEYNSLSEYNVYEQFLSVEWPFLIDIHEMIYPRHLCGFKFDPSSSTITLIVYNRTWFWTFVNFCDILHIPVDGPKMYTRSQDLTDLDVVSSYEIVANTTTSPLATYLCQE